MSYVQASSARGSRFEPLGTSKMKASLAVVAVAAAFLAAPAQSQPQPQVQPAERWGPGGAGGQQGGNWGGPGGPGWLPQGSYQQSCRSATVRGSGRNATLTASCRDGRGRWNYSSIRLQQCRDDVRNDNGRLACGWGGGGGGGGRPPPWQGQGGVTLYSSPDFGGQAFQTSREVTNLPRQYNDRAMSLRIEGRGSWQICSDSDFRGRCQIFNRDVRDLRQYGLGEAVSSMRPVQGQGY
jgi:hypothetical protein